MPAIDFEYTDDSIKVKGLPLWLDSSPYRADKQPVRRSLNFTSHAHADHIGNHKRIICSPPTLDLLKIRQKVSETTVLEWGEVFEIAGAKITLLPAGHVLGSAQILIEKDGHRICYTGDFRLGSGLTTEFCEPVKCDTLLMECTYGSAKYVFPERHELLDQLNQFVEQCFDDQVFPVVLGYSLGKSQEAVKALNDLGYGVVAHKNIYQICQIYKKHGVQFPNLELFHPLKVGRRVIVFPPHKSTRTALEQIGQVRTTIMTGWATDSWRKQLFGADEAIAYSDHCDYQQLLQTVKASGASKIYTHHGDADRFARILRSEGHNAEPLIPADQGSLF